MRGLTPLAFAVFLASTQVGAGAATLRTHAILHGPTVRLSDLFADLKPGQDCDLGPAPAPGKPLLIPGSQLSAIASQYGVEWQKSEGYAAASLERPARLITRSEVIAALTPALVTNGMPPGSPVNLGVFASPSLPADVATAPEVQSLDFDAKSGRFSSVLQVGSGDGSFQMVRVTGRVDQMVTALTPLHAIAPGSQLTARDVILTSLPMATIHGTVLTDVTQAQGLVTRQMLTPGQPILSTQLSRSVLVGRGRPVVLRLANGWLALTASGTALESGGLGDNIHVLNTSSHAVLVGKILDVADIEVDPGTSPVFVAQQGDMNSLPRITDDRRIASTEMPIPAQEAQYP